MHPQTEPVQVQLSVVQQWEGVSLKFANPVSGMLDMTMRMQFADFRCCVCSVSISNMHVWVLFLLGP